MRIFDLCILAAEKPFYDGECLSLVIPTDDGEQGIQAMHNNMIAAITPGLLKATLPDDRKVVAAVSEGLVKVEDNTVLILVDTIEKPEEIDMNRAIRSVEQAREAILQRKSIQDYNSAQAKMARAISRMRAKNYGR